MTQHSAYLNKSLEDYLSSFVSKKRLDRMNEVLNFRTRRTCVVLENVLQTHNASAVLRSADCFGIQDVHLITNDNKFKASKGITRGSHKWLTLTRHNQRGVNNTQKCFSSLRDQGYKIACLHPHASALVDFKDLDFTHNKIALVIGSERDGLSDDAIKDSDYLIKYPMYGYSESFNLSVLAALCMNEIRRILNNLPENHWRLSDLEQKELRLEWIKKTVRESRHLEARFELLKKQEAYPLEPCGSQEVSL